MAESTKRDVMIIGAGLVGPLLAVMLAQRGYGVRMVDRRPDPRDAGFVGGRSINLALSTRGISGLRKAQLADTILPSVIPMRGRMLHSATGQCAFQPYSKNPDDAINSVSRGGLSIALMQAAARLPHVEMHFNQRCLDVNVVESTAAFRCDRTGQECVMKADLIIGADGAFSAVRGAMQKLDRFNFSQHFLEHGYKELHIPPTSDCTFALDPNSLHIWPRGGSMMIALPNQDRSFTCTLFWPYQSGRDPISFESIRTPGQILPFFELHFPDAVPLMPTLVDDYQSNPTSSLVTVRCFPWNVSDRVLLIGDAAHAIVPFYGQGMNAGFEDAEWLVTMIDERIRQDGTGDWAALLDDFSMRRKPHAEAIADMALMNFIEMRDKVGSRSFRVKKKLEQTLHTIFPAWFTPLYNMISFSTIPYARAFARARQQSRVLRGIGFALFATVVIVSMLLIRIIVRS